MLELHAHPYSENPRSKVFVTSEISDDNLIISYNVEANDLNLNKDFNEKNWDNWGLWEHDVVEAFIQKDNPNNHYLELQVSPLNQKFALMVYKPREAFEKIIELPVKTKANITKGGFKASFEIPLTVIPGKGSMVKGNLHACLGKSHEREYFSLKLNPEAKPDFHRPEYFSDIGNSI